MVDREGRLFRDDGKLFDRGWVLDEVTGTSRHEEVRGWVGVELDYENIETPDLGTLPWGFRQECTIIGDFNPTWPWHPGSLSQEELDQIRPVAIKFFEKGYEDWRMVRAIRIKRPEYFLFPGPTLYNVAWLGSLALVAITLPVVGYRVWRTERCQDRLWRLRCPMCAYDLRGTEPTRCPECGHALTKAEKSMLPRTESAPTERESESDN